MNYAILIYDNEAHFATRSEPDPKKRQAYGYLGDLYKCAEGCRRVCGRRRTSGATHRHDRYASRTRSGRCRTGHSPIPRSNWPASI